MTGKGLKNTPFYASQHEPGNSGYTKARRWFHGPKSVQTKFLAGIALILLASCLISAFLIYYYERGQMEEQAFAKSELVMSAVNASREYVRHELRPTMYQELGEDHFVPEAMSTSYVGRSVMERFAPALEEEFEYRRVSLNARNPDFEANELEREKISYFQQNPEQDEWQGVMDSGETECFLRFKPVVFEQECMRCHGSPEDAPEALVNMYGDERGFGHEVGEIAGLSVVSVPVEAASAQVAEKAISVFMVLFSGVLLFYIALVIFFNWVVVNNLRGVLNLFKDEVEEKSVQDFLPESRSQESKDELQELTDAATSMADHLRQTREQLRQYAQNLEQKVEERTRALRHSEERLREQVRARNQELQTLNTLAELTTQAVGLSEILPQVLHRTLQAFPAQGAGIYLYDENQDQLRLQYQENAPALVSWVYFQKTEYSKAPVHAENLGDSIVQAACGQVSYFECNQNAGCLNIPLCCRGRVLGVMTFTGVNEDEISSELHSLLASIGRQIGIAVESLQNMEKLLQSKELLQSVFDGITDQVILLDTDFRLKMVNKAYTQTYDVEPEEVLGRRCYEVHGSGERPCPSCKMKQVIENKQAMEHEIRCADVDKIYQVHCYPNLDENGEVESVIRVVKEITDQKQMEQKIQQTEKLVAMGQLAAGVAHEINNPLGVILCYVDLLKRQLDELPQGKQDLDTIEKQTRNCKRIVSDLLDFARSGETKKQLESVNKVMEEVLSMVSDQFQKQGVQIEVDLDPELPLLHMDVQKIKQVFMNFLMNARQAVQDRGGRIYIGSAYSTSKNFIRMTFLDDGHGIPEYQQDKIFDPFFSTKDTGEGTGLGLSVSYGIVREHNGDITVYSQPGEGTRFVIDLPIQGTEEGRPGSLDRDEMTGNRDQGAEFGRGGSHE